jgi:hypothetical protein
MPTGLEKRTVPILLKKLDQKMPAQGGVTGALDVLQNMIVSKSSEGGYEFAPRPGSAHVSRTADAGSITAGFRFGTLGSSLLLHTGNALYRRATDMWHRVDATVPAVSVASVPIAADTLNVLSTDAVYVNGYTVTATCEQTSAATTYNIVVRITDANGAPVLASVVETGTFLDSVRIVKSGTVAVVFWGDATNTRIRACSVTTASVAIGAAATIASTLYLTLYDVQTLPSGSIACAWRHVITNQLNQVLVNASTLAVTGLTAYAGVASVLGFGYLTNDFSTNVIYIAHIESVGGLSVATFDGTTLALGANTLYDATATTVSAISGYRTGASVSVYWQTAGTSSYDALLYVSTGGAKAVAMRSGQLRSRVLSANGTLYALLRYNAPPESTCFLVDLVAKKVVGMAMPLIAYGGANGTAPWQAISNLATSTSSSVFLTAQLKNVATTTSEGNSSAYVGAQAVSFTLGDTSLGKPVEIADGLFWPGSQPWYYDGARLTEQGFPIGPEISDTPVLASGGSLTPSSTYSYLYVYEWVDAAGRLHRSRPSISAQTVNLGASDTRVTLSLPTLRLTRKQNVAIGVYRTLADSPDVYFKVSSNTSPTYSDPTADRVAFVDSASDATAAAGEPLYTTGEVLENIALPPCKVLAAHKGRLMAGGIEGDQTAIWFSKDVLPGFGVAFSDFNVSRVSSVEAVTGISSLDSYALAFTAHQTWGSTNEYPDDLGNGGVLLYQNSSETEGAPTGLVARNDQGAFVISGPGTAKGIWMLSRGLSYGYVGGQVETDAIAFTPLAVIAVPSQNQIRVVGSTVALVYETLYGTWAKWSYGQAPTSFVDAAMWNGSVAYLCSDGTVIQESTTVYDDNGVVNSVRHRFDPSGLSFAGIAGYARLYGIQITGRCLGSGGFTLQIGQTFDGAAIATKSLAYTGSETELNVEADPGTEGKCSRYNLSVQDASNGANSAYTVLAMTAIVGVKQGMKKLAPARRAT